MKFDRAALKRRTKGMVRQGNPAVWLVTLVFLLATDWVSAVADLVTTNPLTAASDVMVAWYDELVLADGTISQAATNAMMQEIWAGFRGAGAMVTLLVILIIAFYTMVVQLGHHSYSLRVMRGQQSGFGELFSRFYMAGKIIWLEILKLIFIVLWSLLFIFPGVIAYYRYRMAEYILLDNPDISALEAIRRSKRLMQRRKSELFVVDLSFVGWMILYIAATSVASSVLYALGAPTAVVTLGSLAVDTAIYMFLNSYLQLTYAGYYLHLTVGEAPPVGEVDGSDRRNLWDGGTWNR